MGGEETRRQVEDVEAWSGIEDPEAYQVLALDPGGTTGWALFQVHPDAMGPDPELTVHTDKQSLAETVTQIVEFLRPRLRAEADDAFEI